MPFKHLVDMLESRELFFASPTSWDDPFERILQHRGTPWTFAQCWCKRAVSDAMWRIYSSDRTAVRIRTTRDKLRDLGPRIRATHFAQFRVDDVRYDSAREIASELDQIAHGLRVKFDSTRAVDALFLKRDAFDYEAEVRAVVYLTKPGGTRKGAHLRLRVDPHRLIDSVLFDPRADDTYIKVASHYLRTALHFEGPISKSILYRAAEIHIPDEP